MTKKTVRPGAMRVFHTKYLPFIIDEFIKVAPVSYATKEELENVWRTQCEYKQSVADHLEMQSKIFLTLAFERNDPRRFDIELLDDLTDMIAGYLATYLCRAESCVSKASAKEHLKRVLFTENKSIIRNIQKNQENEQKRAARQAAKEQADVATESNRKKPALVVRKAANRLICAVRIDIPELNQKVR